MYRLVLLLAGAIAFAPAAVFAQGEHGRRAGAELRVMIGDVQLLVAGVLSPKRTVGVHHRVEGMLAALPILLRLADQERQQDSTSVEIDRLRQQLSSKRYTELGAQLEQLARIYPFRSRDLLISTLSDRRMTQALTTHRQLCAACHDFPYLDTERPALNLYQQAKQQSVEEFAARMVIGIRGDVVTGLGNPFTDGELAALIALYIQASGSRALTPLR